MPHNAPPSPPSFRWLLGDTPRQRLRLSQQLLATSLMTACVLIVIYAALVAGRPLVWVLVWGVPSLGSLVGCYVLIRSGWSERLEDPAMTGVQIVLALASGSSAYLMGGPLRALVMPIMMVVLVFGMFELRPRQAQAMGALAFGSLVAAVAAGQWLDLGGPLHEELGHLMMALVVFPGVSILAGRISRIRHRLKEQREALNAAVARIEQLATRDELTGLFNRRHGDELLRAALRRRERLALPMCLALLDIDHFKRVNDTHGHAVGDSVLRTFAQAAQSSLRSTDTLARWGGEEFLLLLEGSDTAAALQALERVRAAVRQAGVEAQGRVVGFDFSAGLAAAGSAEDAAALLERADRALYRAKAEGRGRTVVA